MKMMIEKNEVLNNKLLKNRKGQSMVELAMVLPILLVLLMGMIQFGFIFNGHITITSAAREGARLASVGGTDSEVIQRVKEAAEGPLLNIEDHLIFIDRSVDGDDEKLSVRIDGSVNIIVPLIDIFTGNRFEISSESVMRSENIY